MHELVKRFGAPLAPSAGGDTDLMSYFFDDVAESDVLRNKKAWQSHSPALLNWSSCGIGPRVPLSRS